MELSEAELKEWLDYAFQHNYNRIEQAAERLGKKGGNFSAKISASIGEPVTSKYEVPDELAVMEFAISVKNFALIEEPFSVDQWLKFLRDLAGDAHSAEFDAMEKRLEAIRGEQNVRIEMDRVSLTAYQMYEMVAKRKIFANDIDAASFSREFERKLGPAYLMLQFMYDTHCLDMWNLLQHIHDYRKKHSIRPKPVPRENICIYCKAKTGIFDHVEHILPESLGNEYSVLPRGYVCDNCKLSLDNLEDGIHEMLPFSMCLVFSRMGNKRGRLPTLKSRELHIRKQSPNRVELRTFSKRAFPEPEAQEGSMHRFTLQLESKFDPHKIARMLYKAALGKIALERGRDYVLDEKFDVVRRYIVEGGRFQNKMIIFNTGVPSGTLQSEIIELKGVLRADFSILGMKFTIVLGENPKLEPTEALKPEVTVRDLSMA